MTSLACVAFLRHALMLVGCSVHHFSSDILECNLVLDARCSWRYTVAFSLGSTDGISWTVTVLLCSIKVIQAGSVRIPVSFHASESTVHEDPFDHRSPSAANVAAPTTTRGPLKCGRMGSL
ncbi:hypothetical protein EXIGLDRAFT_257639 [Exidia glandulosa HHB12029]|uniref:Secreted protein n=1 Tax=Exidia glandulosa HHB12029 TaxID=1314781 RepID=A0A165DUU4_EXIGL|nr:hypothetical protein EXIGLDRAFT_257639 [Exidia glandulosa HHB12029]